MSKTRDQLESWLKTIEINCDKMLDVGAGGNLVKKRLGKCNTKTYETLDWDKKAKPDYVWDLNYTKAPEDIFEYDQYPFYDVIAAIEISEYIWDPKTAIRNLTNWLMPGGILIMSFHLVYPIHNPPKIDYLRYTREWIEKVFREFRYHEVNIEPRVASDDSLIEFYKNEGMHTRGDGTEYDIGYLCQCKK
jgi:2-polyprenyl-3-methyl-5-hydroxy-6-metoxy-1,4-benzoquinol methylase